MRARMMVLTGLVAILVAAGWAMTSPAWGICHGVHADDATGDDCTADDFADDIDGGQPVIPEPATIALTGLGLTALGMGYRFRRRS